MIQLSHNYSLPEREQENIPIKIVGVGGAGSNALDRIVLDGMEKADLTAMNTDAQSLTASVAAHKVQLGRTVTRGLGTGGDPELGNQAAMESADEIRKALTGAQMIFICVGLGGGSGSGAAPVITQFARETGALVIVFATLPFKFEGKRRAQQAQEALARLNQIANAVICFENDRLGDMVSPKAGIHQAFAAGDIMISQSVRSIVNLVHRPGLIRIGFDDLLTALRSQNGRCLFGFGESESDNRAHDALAQALKNPLMDKGRMLADAANVLVQVAGGPGLTLSEVEILMQDLGKHVRDHTQILFGTSVDGRMGNRLSVTIISSIVTEGEESPAPTAFAAPPVVVPAPSVMKEPPIWEQQVAPEPEPEAVIEPEPEPIAAEIPPAPEPEPIVPGEPEELIPLVPPVSIEAPIAPPPKPSGPRVIVPKKKPPIHKEPALPLPTQAPLIPDKMVHAKQEVMQFEPITRGRFEKSEPTIVEGQDLDVPTYLRKNIRVK
jgi:cell division protein FtsZ